MSTLNFTQETFDPTIWLSAFPAPAGENAIVAFLDNDNSKVFAIQTDLGAFGVFNLDTQAIIAQGTFFNGTQTGVSRGSMWAQDDIGHYYVYSFGSNHFKLYKSHIGAGPLSGVWNGYMIDDANVDVSASFIQITNPNRINIRISPSSNGTRYMIIQTPLSSSGLGQAGYIAVNVDAMTVVGNYISLISGNAASGIASFMDAAGDFWFIWTESTAGPIHFTKWHPANGTVAGGSNNNPKLNVTDTSKTKASLGIPSTQQVVDAIYIASNNSILIICRPFPAVSASDTGDVLTVSLSSLTTLKYLSNDGSFVNSGNYREYFSQQGQLSDGSVLVPGFSVRQILRSIDPVNLVSIDSWDVAVSIDANPALFQVSTVNPTISSAVRRPSPLQFAVVMNGSPVYLLSTPDPPPPSNPCVPVDGNGNLTGGTYIQDLSLFILPETALYTNPILPNAITTSELNNEGRRTIILDFNNGDGLYARDLGTVFEWPTNNGIQVLVWQPSIIPMPEATYSRATDWDDVGSSGAKFVQGVIVEAFSFGNPKTFFLQDSDTLTLHTLNECPVTFAKQQEVAFSCAPFIAHSVRLISSDGVEWRVWKSRLVSQPFPESTLNWQTELTSLGMTGWAHAREMNLAYLSTSAVTLKLTFDSIAPIVLTLPSTSGVQAKTKITLPPNKWKLIGFQASSTSPFRVFQGDIEVKLREWGAQGPYGVVKPFGGQSATGATV